MQQLRELSLSAVVGGNGVGEAWVFEELLGFKDEGTEAYVVDHLVHANRGHGGV